MGEAADGREAIDKVLQCSPDVVLMDIAMPLMDGLEATRRIHKENPKVKILILTQHDNNEYVLSGIKAGAAGCVPKRAVASELVSAMRVVHQGDSYLHPSVAMRMLREYLQRMEHDPYDGLSDREREGTQVSRRGRQQP